MLPQDIPLQFQHNPPLPPPPQQPHAAHNYAVSILTLRGVASWRGTRGCNDGGDRCFVSFFIHCLDPLHLDLNLFSAAYFLKLAFTTHIFLLRSFFFKGTDNFSALIVTAIVCMLVME